MSNTQTTLPFSYIEIDGIKYVSARDLHESLTIPVDFITWCNSIFKYGLGTIQHNRVRIGTGKSHNKVDFLIRCESFLLFAEIGSFLIRKQTARLKKKNQLTRNHICKIIKMPVRKPETRQHKRSPCKVVQMFQI